MFSCLNYLAAMLVFIGRFRSRWLWFPTVILGVFLFWVFMTWNRIPSFCDKIEITSIGHTDSSAVSIIVKHPYFTLNNFRKDFCGFWTDYGTSSAGVNFYIKQNIDLSHDNSLSNSTKINAEVRQFFPHHTLDSIGALYDFRVRKELFGNMNSRNARNKLIKAWDDKGFCVQKRIAKYDENVCVDSIRLLAGANKYSSSIVPVGYSSTMYYTLMRLFRMEDISQFNYNLILDGKTSINRLEVDFGGPVDIKGLWPIPDIVEPSRIVYLSKEKISEIKENGTVKMFCQSLESVNIQNVRLFILTTLASLCLAYTLRELGVFILFCCRYVQRKWGRRWEKEEKTIVGFFRNMKIDMKNFGQKIKVLNKN